jgi:hypothetical protein
VWREQQGRSALALAVAVLELDPLCPLVVGGGVGERIVRHCLFYIYITWKLKLWRCGFSFSEEEEELPSCPLIPGLVASLYNQPTNPPTKLSPPS